MKFKFFNTLLLSILFSCSLNAQDTLQIDSLSKYQLFGRDLSYYLDATNKETIETIQSKSFGKIALPDKFDYQKTYWASCYLPQNEHYYYRIDHTFKDSIVYYIPKIDGTYEANYFGKFVRKKRKLEEYYSFNLKTDEVDFSKPVFIKIRNFSKWSSSDFRSLRIMPYSKKSPLLYSSDDIDIMVLFGGFALVLSFLLIYFLVQFIINRQLPFLYYSLYLLALLFYFSNRILFFRYFFEGIIPNSYFYINEDMQILSSVFYLLFVRYFLDLSVRFPKLDKLLKVAVFVFLSFMVVYNLVFVIDRFNPIHHSFMTYFRGLNALLSVGVTVFFIIKKSKIIDWIVIASSVILLLGSIIPAILNQMQYSIFFMLGAILVLAIGLAYKTRQNDLERIRVKEQLIEQLNINAAIQEEMQEKLKYEVEVQTTKAVRKTQEAEQAKAEQLRLTFERELEQIKMKALQTQMNPHFLFNCLNSIRLFYLKNETEKADTYITKFSRLLRMILNNSRANFITLQEELDALRLYIEFEQMRFRNKFDFELNIDEEANISNLKIQPMIIQPFVENAIWHGLMQSDKKGKLSIDINKKNEQVVITVLDNGIGRQKANEIKKNQSQIHQSHGLNITRERIELMRKSSNQRINFKITDLFNSKNQAAGTKVEITYA